MATAQDFTITTAPMPPAANGFSLQPHPTDQAPADKYSPHKAAAVLRSGHPSAVAEAQVVPLALPPQQKEQPELGVPAETLVWLWEPAGECLHGMKKFTLAQVRSELRLADGLQVMFGQALLQTHASTARSALTTGWY